MLLARWCSPSFSDAGHHGPTPAAYPVALSSQPYVSPEPARAEGDTRRRLLLPPDGEPMLPPGMPRLYLGRIGNVPSRC